MRPLPTFWIAIALASLLTCFCAAGVTSAQCPSFTFSATAGPTHRDITLTIGGQINGTALVQQRVNGNWVTIISTLQTGNWTLEFGHNQTVEFQGTNGGSCINWIYATATT